MHAQDRKPPRGQTEANVIIQEFYQKKAEERQAQKDFENKKNTKNRIRKFLSRLGIFIIVILSVRLVVVVLTESPLMKKPDYWVVGVKDTSSYKITECISRMWKIRSAMDSYYQKKSTYPSEIEDLYGQGFLSEKVVCPVSGKKYIFKQINNTLVFCCPNPVLHNVKELWAHVNSGPPAVER